MEDPKSWRSTMAVTQSILRRERTVSEQEFRGLIARKVIRAASLEDVHGTHHKRPLYRHPRTGQWFVAVSAN